MGARGLAACYSKVVSISTCGGQEDGLYDKSFSEHEWHSPLLCHPTSLMVSSNKVYTLPNQQQ